MVKYHIIDEAVLDATPEEIDNAFADEAAGRSSWWAPKVLMRTRDGRRPDEIGAVTDYRVSMGGRADRPGAVRFTTRVTSAEPGRIVTDYVDGHFRGRRVLTTESVGEGRTRIRDDWQTETHGWAMGPHGAGRRHRGGPLACRAGGIRRHGALHRRATGTCELSG